MAPLELSANQKREPPVYSLDFLLQQHSNTSVNFFFILLLMAKCFSRILVSLACRSTLISESSKTFIRSHSWQVSIFSRPKLKLNSVLKISRNFHFGKHFTFFSKEQFRTYSLYIRRIFICGFKYFLFVDAALWCDSYVGNKIIKCLTKFKSRFFYFFLGYFPRFSTADGFLFIFFNNLVKNDLETCKHFEINCKHTRCCTPFESVRKYLHDDFLPGIIRLSRSSNVNLFINDLNCNVFCLQLSNR